MTLVAALAATVGGCDSDPGAQIAGQRDVYTGPHAFQDCVADWGNEQLCQQRLDKEDAKRLAEANKASGHSNFIFLYSGGYGYYGPSYSPGTRSTVYNGQTYAPSMARATQTAAFTDLAHGARPAAFTKPHPMGVRTSSFAPNMTSRPVFRPTATRFGGFGATGRSFGSSSS